MQHTVTEDDCHNLHVRGMHACRLWTPGGTRTRKLLLCLPEKRLFVLIVVHGVKTSKVTWQPAQLCCEQLYTVQMYSVHTVLNCCLRAAVPTSCYRMAHWDAPWSKSTTS